MFKLSKYNNTQIIRDVFASIGTSLRDWVLAQRGNLIGAALNVEVNNMFMRGTAPSRLLRARTLAKTPQSGHKNAKKLM